MPADLQMSTVYSAAASVIGSTDTKTRPLALVRNSTWPSISANSVWSLARPTLWPGCHFVTKSSLLLALAAAFRLFWLFRRGSGGFPRRRGLGFRLRRLGRCDDGVGFLGRGRRFRGRLRLALGLRPGGLGRGRAVGQDFGHADEGELLPVAALPARILPAALLEGDDLRPAALLQHLGGDRSAGHHGGAERDVVAAHDQHLAELDDLARVALDLGDLQHVLGGDAVLLAAGFDVCEHLSVLVFDSGARIVPDRLLSVGLWIWRHQMAAN